jgi:hypothetical protein
MRKEREVWAGFLRLGSAFRMNFNALPAVSYFGRSQTLGRLPGIWRLAVRPKKWLKNIGLLRGELVSGGDCRWILGMRIRGRWLGVECEGQREEEGEGSEQGLSGSISQN